MTNDLISRSALLEEIRKCTIISDDIYCMGIMAGVDAVNKKVETAPAVDAVAIHCKIGNTVWGIRRLSGGHVRAFQGTVSEMQFIGSEMRLSITARGVCRGEWGKTIFATQEEAEEEIKRRDNDGK